MKQRFRVVIRCSKCGEKYILRGRKKDAGGYETGFIRCVCGNEDKLKVDVTPE
ncbi:hypothetical protein [Alkalihalobacterium bogoriense]|uniref:hypothetical protein n=1 Tax=Alkalihalobacterium bogoriense TaxID=246272 RepID=UPI000AA7AD5A|nr:hypothetical protein [Alkalihalobacterium bogoriense]